MRSIFFLDKVSPQAHYLQREVGNAGSLKVIPESRAAAIEFLSFLSSQHAIASCSRFANWQFYQSAYQPLAAAEVGFCRASPGVGFRGNGHIIISVLFPLISPSDGRHFCLREKAWIFLEGWLQQPSQQSQQHFAALTSLWCIRVTSHILLDLERRSIQSSVSEHHIIFNISIAVDVTWQIYNM